jgi:outer membrane lipoprotein-sorting protein
MPRIDEIKQQVANKFKDAIINVDQPRATQFTFTPPPGTTVIRP